MVSVGKPQAWSLTEKDHDSNAFIHYRAHIILELR